MHLIYLLISSDMRGHPHPLYEIQRRQRLAGREELTGGNQAQPVMIAHVV